VASRSDRERIATAREAAARARLRSAGFLPADVDRLLADWAELHVGRGVDRFERRYWDELDRWVGVEERLVAERSPRNDPKP
jgi:hypothetical protein